MPHTFPGYPPLPNLIMIYAQAVPLPMISKVRWEESSLWNMFLRLAQTLPSSKLTLFLPLSLFVWAVRQAPQVSSKAGTAGCFFNEYPTGTASGKTPRPGESKTAAVLKCRSGCTQRPCNLYFGRPLWQIRASQLRKQKAWTNYCFSLRGTQAHYCSNSVFQTFATPPEKQTTTKDTAYPTFTYSKKNSFIPCQRKEDNTGIWGQNSHKLRNAISFSSVIEWTVHISKHMVN